MYRTTNHRNNLGDSYRTTDGRGFRSAGGVGRGEESGGYAPVDPFKASLALGIKKVFGSTRDRTIDDVPVAGMVREPPMTAPYPEPHAYQPPPAPYLDGHGLSRPHRGYYDPQRPYEPPVPFTTPPRGWYHGPPFPPGGPERPVNLPPRSPEPMPRYVPHTPERPSSSRSRSTRRRSRDRERRSRSRGRSRIGSYTPEYLGNLDTGYPLTAPYPSQQGPPIVIPWMPTPPQPPIPVIPGTSVPLGTPRLYAPIVTNREERSSTGSRSRSPRREHVGVVHHLRATRQLPPTEVAMLPPDLAPTLPLHETPVVPVVISPRSRSHSPEYPMSLPQVPAVTIPPVLPLPPSTAPVIVQQPQVYEDARRRSISPSPVRRGRSPPRHAPVNSMQPMQPTVIVQPRSRSRSPDSMQANGIMRPRSRSRSLSQRSWYLPRPVSGTSPHARLGEGRQRIWRSSRSESRSRSISPPLPDPMYTLPSALRHQRIPLKKLAYWGGEDNHPVFQADSYYPAVVDAQTHSHTIPGRRRYSRHHAGDMVVEATWFTLVLSLLLDVVPRQVYLHLLLRFPSLYFSRVTRIFQDADLGMGEIKRMALEAIELDKAREGLNQKLLYQGVFPQDWHSGAGAQPVSYMNLRNSWQAFIDSLMREWKTLNIVSVLLLSAILTILQIESAAANPLTRFSALLSLICAFMSLIYGCLYIIRFGTMRKTHKAAEWANESEKTSTSIFWNVWVMLSMPAVWLGWSMIFYIICVMSFVWQTGTVSQTREYLPTDLEILIPRIVISCILALGFIYLVLVVATFSRYSDPMEQAWQARIRGWLAEKTYGTLSGQYPPHVYPQGPPIGTTHPGRPYEGRSAKTGDGTRVMDLSNTKSKAGNADGYQAPQVKSRELYASGPPRETSARKQPQPKSMPNFATTSRTVPLSHGGIQTAGDAFVNAFQANRNPDLYGSPFIPELRTLEMQEVQARLIPMAQPTSTHPSHSIDHRDLVSAPSASRVGQEPAKDDTGTSTPVDIPDSEHPRHFISARKDEISGNCVATVVAVPLRDASTVDGESVALEEMEEVYKFDLRVKDVGDSEGGGRDGLVESKASTLRMSGTSIPLPRQLLEEGLAVPTWERFCKDIFSAWRCVVEDRTNALSDMIGVVSAWNDHLEFFGVFLALVRFDDTAHEGSPTPSYSLYLGPREAVRVGVRAPGSSCRPFRLAHKGFQMSEFGLPEMIGLVDGNDAVLKFSDGAHGGDAERPVEDRE